MIKAEKLTYTYPGEKQPAVREINFNIKPGEIFGFLGPSGAGKSTTQKILTGLLRGWKGSIKIEGEELSSLKNEYYEQTGVAFEFPHFYLKFTARENLSFFARLYRNVSGLEKKTLDKKLMTLLEQTGLAEDADKKVGEYSKGMKMRLNLCRALIHNPKLLFLDEPTSGLDPVNSRNIRKIIRSESLQGKTVFLTTHNMEVASELCDRVAFLNEGRLEVIDTPKNLMMKHGTAEVRIEFGENGTQEYRDFPMENLGNNGEFIELIRKEKLKTIHSREATLEDVFVKLTGRGLEWRPSC